MEKECRHEFLEAIIPASEENGFIYRCTECGLALEFNLVKQLTPTYAYVVFAALPPKHQEKVLQHIVDEAGLLDEPPVEKQKQGSPENIPVSDEIAAASAITITEGEDEEEETFQD